MNSRILIPRLMLAGGGAALAWMLFPASGEASSTSWGRLDAVSASFLQQGPAQAWSSATGGGARNHLPSSVMPNGTVGLTCSVDTTDIGNPPRCSASSAAPRCSAHCDNAQRCSAYVAAAAGGNAVCSTLGGVNTQCSVLQPVIQGAAASQCSAFGGVPGSTIQCSVMGPGNAQKCSAQNPARFQGNVCSTIALGAVGGTHQCSVLKGGIQARNYCSVGAGVPSGFMPKMCSTFAQNSQCSVLPGNRGICTTFNPAPAGTCSIFVHGSTCSVIGGASGTFCVQ